MTKDFRWTYEFVAPRNGELTGMFVGSTRIEFEAMQVHAGEKISIEYNPHTGIVYETKKLPEHETVKLLEEGHSE